MIACLVPIARRRNSMRISPRRATRVTIKKQACLVIKIEMDAVMTNGSDAPGPPPDNMERPPSPPPPPPEDSAAPPPPAPDDGAPPPPPEDIPPPPPIETKKKKGWGVKKPSATPLSVEDLIRKKKEADAAAAKVCNVLCDVCDLHCSATQEQN